MKRLGFLICVSLFPLLLNAQWFDNPIIELDAANYIVKYDLTYIEDTNNIQDIGEETMILLIGNEVSSFQSFNSYRFSQVGRKKKEEGTLDDWIESGAIMQYKARYTYDIYKNYPKGKITTIDDLMLSDRRLVYEENATQLEWMVLDDTTTHSGYLCQKARCEFGGRVWEAWYTEELPFSDGPYKFCGLPGLILNLADTKNHYSFKFLSIEKIQESMPIEWEEDDYVKTTKKKFYEAYRNSVSTIEDNGAVSEAIAKRIKHVLQSRNNPIELERK